MPSFRVRLWFAGAVLCLFCGAVVWRLVTIQIVHAEEFSRLSRAQSQQRVVIRAQRGSIVDRRGRELAQSVESKGSVAAGGVHARVYPYGELAGAVLGWTGRDGDGLGGTEQEFDHLLRGEDGWAVQQRDARSLPGGRSRYRTISLPQRLPRRGSDIGLTLDVAVQRIVENVLVRTCERLGASSAMAIVMEPHSGRILAMAQHPSFDPNVAARYPLEQRRNYCISRNFEPGSTFKVVAAATALEQNLFSESDSLHGNNGVYRIYDQSIRDHQPYGMLSFADALVYSSNVCFAKIADRIGSRSLHDATRDFGFGAPTRVSLPGEEAGVVHPVSSWSGRTRVTLAMGHELSATLLQMAVLYGAIANDGVLVRPRLLDRIVAERGGVAESSTLQPVRRVLSADVAARLRVILEQVVVRGTGRRAGIDAVAVAGKTGTSQIFDRETGGYSASRYHASFIGFAPADKPALLCAVVVTEPAGGETGGLAAAPAWREIMEQILAHPELEYAPLLLRAPSQRGEEHLPSGRIEVPQVAGMTGHEAAQVLRRHGLGFEFVGSSRTVASQRPSAGMRVAPRSMVTLFTGREDAHPGDTAGVQVAIVPDCVGKDLREAITLLLMKGVVPVVSGAGFVTRQSPAVGAVVTEASVCSLFASFGG